MSLSSAPISEPRLRTLVVPREHGAWGMLLVPLATGAAAGLMRGGQALPLAIFTTAAMAVFWLPNSWKSTKSRQFGWRVSRTIK